MDAVAKRFDAMWHVPDLGPLAGPLRLTSTELEFATLKDGCFWLWDYGLPQVRLKERDVISLPALDTLKTVSLTACGKKGSSTVPTVKKSGDGDLLPRQILHRTGSSLVVQSTR